MIARVTRTSGEPPNVSGVVSRSGCEPDMWVDMTAFVEFLHEHQPVIVTAEGDGLEIEIYDDYRE